MSRISAVSSVAASRRGHLEQRSRLPLAAPALREQPRISNGGGGLIGERLRQPDLLLGKHPPRAVAQDEHAEHALLHEKRQRHHRSERSPFHPRPLLRGLRNPRIVEEIGRHDRLALLRGHSGRAEADAIHDGLIARPPVIALERQ